MSNDSKRTPEEWARLSSGLCGCPPLDGITLWRNACRDCMTEDFATAIAQAEARGRRAGLEEAERVARNHGDVCLICAHNIGDDIRDLRRR